MKKPRLGCQRGLCVRYGVILAGSGILLTARVLVVPLLAPPQQNTTQTSTTQVYFFLGQGFCFGGRIRSTPARARSVGVFALVGVFAAQGAGVRSVHASRPRALCCFFGGGLSAPKNNKRAGTRAGTLQIFHNEIFFFLGV